ncbi:MAG: SHOCT domain-containing protein [Christensenellales bacterium]
MEQDLKFLKRDTKTGIVVTSVIVSIAVIAMIMTAILAKISVSNVMAVGTSIIVILTAIATGISQIKVFRDYKSVKKSLCADGIFNICISALILITGVIYLFMRNSTFDLRYFISVFVLAFAIWKIIIGIKAFKEKRNNAWLDVVLATFWFTSGILLILTAIFNTDTTLIIFAVSNFLLLITEVVYLLYSYIFKTPDYLATDEAIAIIKNEQAERQLRLNRYNALAGKTIQETTVEEKKENNNENDLKTKLSKLNALKMEGIISEEEYAEKRKKIIDESI